MPWLQVEISGNPDNADAISEVLTSAGAVAVTLQDVADEPVFEPEHGTTPLWTQTRIIGLFDTNSDVETVKTALQQAWHQAEPIAYNMMLLEDQDWERVWMKNYHPMRFGKRLWICPSWCEVPDPQAINILLDPGLAFGTGTHATTALCLEWLDAHSVTDQLVVDYGCGSGILALAAAKLGAAKIYAIDNDSQALEATRNNAEHNQISHQQLLTYLPDEAVVPDTVDLVIANILAKPLITLIPTFVAMTRPGSKIALSGILESQHDEIYQTYKPWFNLSVKKSLDGWICLSGIRI